MASKSKAVPNEAPKEKSEELFEELLFSPFVFVAWGLQAITTPVMLVCISLMLMPVGMRYLVAALGGRGAWAESRAATVVSCTKIKGQYLIPPLVVMFYFRKDNEDGDFVGQLVCGYIGLVAVNLASGGQLSQ